MHDVQQLDADMKLEDMSRDKDLRQCKEQAGGVQLHPHIEMLMGLNPGLKGEASQKRQAYVEESLEVHVEPEQIFVRGAQQHNLKNIDVAIPRNKFVVLTGVS